MVPTDTFTLCPVLSPPAPIPFRFDQYQSLKWLSEEIKTYENQQQGRVLMLVSGDGTKSISFIFIFSAGAVQWARAPKKVPTMSKDVLQLIHHWTGTPHTLTSTLHSSL